MILCVFSPDIVEVSAVLGTFIWKTDPFSCFILPFSGLGRSPYIRILLPHGDLGVRRESIRASLRKALHPATDDVACQRKSGVRGAREGGPPGEHGRRSERIQVRTSKDLERKRCGKQALMCHPATHVHIQCPTTKVPCSPTAGMEWSDH